MIKLLNQLLNVFWTIIGFTAVFVFWLSYPIYPWLYILLGISFLSILIPDDLYRVSTNKRMYEKLGVKVIRKLVQDGDLIKSFWKANTRKTIKPVGINAHLKNSYMYQHYHLMCCVFFILTIGLAIKNGDLWVSIAIFISNIFYNIYPILLQQYNRLRIQRILKNKC